MKNLLMMLLGSTLLVSPSLAQSENDISLPEFRQTLTDYLTATDAYRGTKYVDLLPHVPDATLAQWYRAVPNGRQFQQAVSALKARIMSPTRGASRPGAAGQSRPASMLSANSSRGSGLAQSRLAQSSPFSAGIGSTPVPDYSLFAPLYASGPNWTSMTGTLQGLGYLPGGDVTDQRCDSNDEANLSTVVGTFHGIKDLADQICAAIPDPVVIVLGEGTKIPAKEVCYGINLIVGAFNSAFDGFLGDCKQADGLVDGSQIEAAYNNSIALYNLEFRLTVEENLQNTLAPTGLFELPNSVGGYLEQVRAIVGDVISNMLIAGQSVSTANASVTQGDAFYNAKQYKSAYKAYQKAYGLAVQ